MATVNHVRINNIPLNYGSTVAEPLWQLTRALKKAGWKYRASSGSSVKDASSDPALDKWGSGGVSNTGGSAASIAAPVRGRAVITGLSGIVAKDKGRFLSISGAATGANNNQHQIEEILSATSVRIDARNFAVASDANNGSLTWTILDPTLEDWVPYQGSVMGTAISWWCAQGPSVLKIPITSGATGVLVRGENVVQATTGAEGELLGYTYYSGTGWLVIAPRVRGTGSGVHGWETSYVITGDRSLATVTQNGTAIDYVYEVVLAKPATGANYQIFLIQADTVGESTELFSYCATQAGCTATVQPGAGGTGNGFGAHAWVLWGTGTTSTTSQPAVNTSYAMRAVNGFVVCVDAIPEQNYSADGTWSLFMNTAYASSQSPSIGGQLFGFHCLNDTEDGEVSPYVGVAPLGFKTAYGNNRLTAGIVGSLTGYYQHDQWSVASHNGLQAVHGASSGAWYTGWGGRGTANEAFYEFSPAGLYATQTNFIVRDHAGFYGYPMRMRASANPVTKSREKLWLTATTRMYKGSLRWLYWINGGTLFDGYGEDPGWVQISNGTGIVFYVLNGTLAGSLPSNGAAVLGPWDGEHWYSNPGL